MSLSLIFFLSFPICLDDPRVSAAIIALHICIYALASHAVIFIYNLSVVEKLNLKLETIQTLYSNYLNL